MSLPLCRASSKMSIMPSGVTQRSDTKVLLSLKRNTPGRLPVERRHVCPSHRVHSRVRQFLATCRLCINMSGKCSSQLLSWLLHSFFRRLQYRTRAGQRLDRQIRRPPRSQNRPIDWVERIPFSETRNYVQRVLENLQVYRVRFGGGSRLRIEADLRRGASSN